MFGKFSPQGNHKKPLKAQKAGNKLENDFMLQRITNTINNLDLDSENDEQRNQAPTRPSQTANPEVMISSKFNAMNLFAYNADDQDDNIASAFAQSRLFQWQNKVSKDECQDQGHHADQNSIGSGLIDSKNIWQIPNLQGSMSQESNSSF